jgi:D-3-phosphoglycerate dehydrogenase
LQFIAQWVRVWYRLWYALSKNIELIAAPEGNSNAVAEHTLGMILSLFNKLNVADREIRSGH